MNDRPPDEPGAPGSRSTERSLLPAMLWTGTDGQLFLGRPGEGNARRLSWTAKDFDLQDMGLVVLPSDMGGARLFAQPCASPNSRHVASFALPVGSIGEDGTPVLTGGGSVYVFDPLASDDLHLQRIYDMGTAGPVHLSWRSDSGAVRIVIQDEDELQLIEVELHEDAAPRLLARGSPLFHAPFKDGRLTVHTGGDVRVNKEARLVLLDPARETRQTLCSVPGTFPTAAWSPTGERIAYSMAGDGLTSALTVSGLRGEELKALLTYDGRAAFSWREDGRSLLVALGSDTEMHFNELVEVSLDGSQQRIFQGAIQAFYQTRRGVVVLRTDRLTNLTEYLLLPRSGGTRSLFTLSLTDEQRFATHFFDQFNVGHPMVSRDGAWILSCGYQAQGIEVDRSGPPRLIVHHLDEAGPIAAADAVFGCFQP